MEREIVVRIEFGSHLYGTSTPTSDRDYKSVYVPSAEEILLQRVKGSLGHKVKRFEGDKNSPEDIDDEMYSLQRYLGLLAEGQTVAIDMLFAPTPLITSPLWEEIRANKHLLLTKRSAAFVGYCRTQANKYGIKGSRVAAAKEAAEFFTAQYASLGASAKLREIAESLPVAGEHSKIVELETIPGSTEKFFECCNRKVSFGNTIKAASEIFSRIYENYGKRARLAESNEGVDWKALSHAVRVANEALELLATGNVTFPLLNAAHILDIKCGLISYDEVASRIEVLLEDVERVSAISTLREEADQDFIDALVCRVHGQKVTPSSTACDRILADAQRRQMELMPCGHPKRYEHIFLPGQIGCLICELNTGHKQMSELRSALSAGDAPFANLLNHIRELVEMRRQVTPYIYPFTCLLCSKPVDSEADLVWHGLGNCVDICSRCSGGGEEPKFPPRPKIVCLCGSVRFFPYFQEANYQETMAGNIVLSVGFYPRAADSEHNESVGITPEQKIALDELYFRKIELADEILVLNVNGYIGESTSREIAHAKKLGKGIRYLEPKKG